MAAPSPEPGDQVYFMSGRHLGKVEALRAGRFRVAGDDGSRWLESRVVFTVDQHRVTLICEADGLGNYTVDD